VGKKQEKTRQKREISKGRMMRQRDDRQEDKRKGGSNNIREYDSEALKT